MARDLLVISKTRSYVHIISLVSYIEGPYTSLDTNQRD